MHLCEMLNDDILGQFCADLYDMTRCLSNYDYTQVFGLGFSGHVMIVNGVR